jgi:hypothetical protein
MTWMCWVGLWASFCGGVCVAAICWGWAAGELP